MSAKTPTYRYEGKGFKKRPRDGSGYPQEFHLGLYRSMVRIRIIEEEIERRYKEDHMKTPIHLVIGQEATSVGLAAAMRKSDQLWATHRTHGNYLAKGGDLKAMLSEMHCRANGCVGSRGGSMHLIDPSVGMAWTSAIVGGVVPIATGAALAAQVQGKDTVHAVCFGDAANEEGVTGESYNFAALKKLPIVYFCENNFYSVCSPLEFRQPEVPIWKRAQAFGLHAELIDGTNVLEVYDACVRAIERARTGKGPSFIEATCYRYRAHGGAGDDTPTGYREAADVEDWYKKADPINTYADYLRGAALLDDVTHQRFVKEARAETAAAFEHALASPNPVEGDLAQHVYAD